MAVFNGCDRDAVDIIPWTDLFMLQHLVVQSSCNRRVHQVNQRPIAISDSLLERCWALCQESPNRSLDKIFHRPFSFIEARIFRLLYVVTKLVDDGISRSIQDGGERREDEHLPRYSIAKDTKGLNELGVVAYDGSE